MANKLQQFYVLSLETSYLKSNDYKVKNLSINEARKNNFIISLADSQLLRTIRKTNNIEFSKLKEDLSMLWKQRAKVKKKKNSQSNIDLILEISNKIDKMLFVNDIVSVRVSHTSHYKHIAKNGFYVNGRKFVRFLAGAGHLRRSTVFFISEGIEKQVRKNLENGMDKTIPLNYGKFSAYFGLYSSASHEITKPKFVVIPDLEIKRMRDVSFVEDDNETVSDKTIEVVHNVFDGMGIVSIDMAKQWSYDMGLDYDAVEFIVRAPFTKGLLVSFPFHSFAREHGISLIKDIYGTEHNIFDIDVILTESQFKMKSHYKSLLEFFNKCDDNDLGWGVTRVNPKIEKKNFWSSYQFLQVLKKETRTEEIVKDTLAYFKDVSSMDAVKTMIYLMGESLENDKLNLDEIDNPIVKILAMNKKSIKDPHIMKNIVKSLNRKIKDSYCGKLIMKGHYEFFVSDPYALCQKAFFPEMNPRDMGLLKEGQSYSKYWNKEGKNSVVSGRSPLTYKSELLKLNLVDSEILEKYYGHLSSGIVFSIHGMETLFFADGDFDGDILFSTDNEEMVNNCEINGKPVSYEKKTAPKQTLDYSEIWENDIKSFSQKIGLITNYSSTYYSMQSIYDKDSEEYKKIEDRLKICRKGQGDSIDSTKGIEVSKFPDWSRQIKGSEIHNKLLVKKRPFWMQYLYQYKKKEWDNHYHSYDFYSQIVFEMSIDDLLKKENQNEEQEKIISRFKKYSPLLIGSIGVVDKISEKMVSSISEMKADYKNSNFDYSIYQSTNPDIDETLKLEIKKKIKLYNRMRKDFYLSSSEHDTLFSIFEVIKKDLFGVCSDLTKLTDNAIELCYGEMKSNYDFIWNIFIDGILSNMRKRYSKYKIPFPNKDGNIEFLQNRYSILEVKIGQEESKKDYS